MDTNDIEMKDGAANNPPADASGITQVQPESYEGEGKLREQEKFDHPAEYWLSCIGYAVGFGNVWRFPYMVYTMGGAAFLIPYAISLFFIAMPMYMVETLYGQLIRTKLQERYGVISKAFWAVAITQVVCCFLTTIYYVTLMAWSFSYFFDAFKDPFPWVMSKAEIDAKTKADAVKIANLKAGEKFSALKRSNIWNPDYFYKGTLDRTGGITETGSLNGHLVFCLFLSYLILYFSAWRGVKSTGKMVWVTCTMPYVILTILFIKGLTLEGADKGVKFLFIPDWSKIGEIKIWQ